jgi:hypothetical protein
MCCKWQQSQTCLSWLQRLPKSCLLPAELQERDAFLSIYPQGYHKTDKMVRHSAHAMTCHHSCEGNQGYRSHLFICSVAQGRPVYIQHIGAIKIKQLAEITTEDRMIRFHVQVLLTLMFTLGEAAVPSVCIRRQFLGCCAYVVNVRLFCVFFSFDNNPVSSPACPLQEYERCLKYIFPSCSKKAGRHIDQTFAIMDVKVCWPLPSHPCMPTYSRQERFLAKACRRVWA